MKPPIQPNNTTTRRVIRRLSRSTAVQMDKPDHLPHFVAFMVRIPHANRVQLQNVIEKYCTDASGTKYLLAKEKDTQDREHFHGIIICTDEEYDKIQRHFREKWKLKGQAQKGKLKEYGRIRAIRDKAKCLAYTIKDKNVYASDSWNIDLKKYEEISFQKKDPKQNKQLREKELKAYLINKNVVIETQNIRDMENSEFSSYSTICKDICRIYNKYHYDFPTLKTINKLLIRYGVMDLEDYLTDHLNRWFNVREKPQLQHQNFEQIITDQINKTLVTLENYYLMN